jgi:diguanylate cyclase (GGDEF)-like protein
MSKNATPDKRPLEEARRPESGIRLSPPRAQEVFRLWDEDENTEVSMSTSLIPAAKRRAGHPRLTVITGFGAGRVIRLDEKDAYIIGRSRAVDIRIDDTGVSREHCRIVRRDGRVFIQDLESRNGTLLNGSPITSMPLAPGDRIQLGANAVLQYGVLDDTEDNLLNNLYEASTRDPLTGVFNRRYFTQRLEIEMSHARRHESHLSVMMIDVDHFKQVNDAHGHAAGDQLLWALGHAISERVRAEDVLARYGGEEFAIIVRDTPRPLTHLFAERIRVHVESLRLPCQKTILRASVSIGVAALAECEPSATLEQFVKAADERLYRAKSLGRNKVCST